MTSTAERGFLYVATGARFVDEALRSAHSIRRTSPGERIAVITDANSERVATDSGVFDDITVLETPAYSFRDKLAMVRTPYSRTIFLDTDTLAIGDMSVLFRLLDRYDVFARPEVSPGLDYAFFEDGDHWQRDAFPEFTTGVIGFRMTPDVKNFFAEWTRVYGEMLAIGPRFIPDQPSFRKVLFESSLRHCDIPPEFHVQADFGGYLYGPARLVHTHNNIERAGQVVNSIEGPRAYHPLFGCVPLVFRGKRALAKEMSIIIRAMLRQLLRPSA